MYYKIFRYQEADRRLYLAVTKTIYEGIFSQAIGRLLLEDSAFRLLVFDEENEVIVQWIPA